jgi:hypothetical protein
MRNHVRPSDEHPSITALRESSTSKSFYEEIQSHQQHKGTKNLFAAFKFFVGIVAVITALLVVVAITLTPEGSAHVIAGFRSLFNH